MSNQSFDLFVGGQLLESSDDHTALSTKARELSSAFVADGKKVTVIIKRHSEVAGPAVEIDPELVKQSLANMAAVSQAKADAWRAFQRATDAERVGLLAKAASALVSHPATKNLDVPKYVAQGVLLTEKQVRFIIERFTELEQIKA